MIEVIIQFFYNKTHKHSHRFIVDLHMSIKYIYHIPVGNIVIWYFDKNIIHDITDDRIIKL